MDTKKQLEKVRSELKKLEEKESSLKERKKELISTLERLELELELKQKDQIIDVIKEHFGEIDDITLFQKVMEEESEVLQRRRDQLSQRVSDTLGY